MSDEVLAYSDDQTLTGAEATIHRLELTLLTEKGSTSDPDFGFDVSGIIDEHLTPELVYTIRSDLIRLLTDNFPDVELLDFKVEKIDRGIIQLKLKIRILEDNNVSDVNIEFTGD